MTKRAGTNRQDGSYGPGGSNAGASGQGSQDAARAQEEVTAAAQKTLDSYKKQNSEIEKQVALLRQINRQKALPAELKKLETSEEDKKRNAERKKANELASQYLRQARIIRNVQEVTGSKALGQALLLRETLKKGGREGVAEGFFLMASMAGDAYKFMSQLVKEQRTLKMDAIENAKTIGGTSADFQQFAQKMGDWDKVLNAPENWSRDFYEKLKHMGLKSSEIVTILDKFHQGMAPENLGLDKSMAMAEGFLSLEGRMRERLHFNKNARMGREEVMSQFADNAPVQELMFKAMGKQVTFSASEIATLFDKVMKEQSTVAIDPGTVTTETSKLSRGIRTWFYDKYILPASADFELFAKKINNGEIGDIGELGAELFGIHSSAGVAATVGVHDIYADLEAAWKTAGQHASKGFDAGTYDMQAMMVDRSKEVLDAFKRGLGIHSPSTEFRFAGNMVGRGLELGMQDSTPAVSRAMSDMVGTPKLAPVSNSSSTSVSVSMGDTNVHSNSDASAQELGEDLAAAHAIRLHQYLSSIAGQLSGTA